MLQSSTQISAPRPAPALERRRRWEQRQRRRLLITDAIIISGSAGVGLVAQHLGSDVLALKGLHAGALVLLWLLLLSGFHSRRNEVLGSGVTEYRRVVHASGLAFGLFAACGILFDWDGIRIMLFVVGPTAIIGLLLGRWLWRRWLHRQRMSGRHLSRTLVVGLEQDVRYVIQSLHTGGENGFHVIAATIFDPQKPSKTKDLKRALESNGMTPSTLTIGEHLIPVEGCIDSVAATAALIEADRIVVASSPPDQPEFVKQLSWQLEGKASELVLSHRITDVVGPRISFQPVDGLPLLKIRIPSYEGGKHLLKRVLDICVASLALIPILLCTPLIALAISLDSPGPVLYRQERLGRDGRKFLMFKFRTMRVGADTEIETLLTHNDGAGPLFKMRSDPRVTRVGRILRTLSIDELPQFWNVIIGDMSVVGPRPPLPSEAQQYDSVVTRRLYIKPGITGLWQISGRSDLSWEESVRLDLRYVENWSLMQDIQIMWRTAQVMIHAKGAY